MTTALDFLASRGSTPSRLLTDPGPSPEQLHQLLEIGLRVPDHGRIEPFRFVLIDRQRGAELGERLAQRLTARDPGATVAAVDKERGRFVRAPMTITVVCSPCVGHKVPESEQQLSAGCVAMMLLLAAEASGFGAQWLTGWPAYDREVMGWLGLSEEESIAGFIYIGTASADRPNRPRPDLNAKLSYYGE